jgi:hypothetical protein
MRLHTCQDESRSRRLNLIGGGGHPWSIDLVSVTASGILLVGLRVCPRSPVRPLDSGRARVIP